ncbi:Carbamoyl-phosphate synthase small chain [Candidatus Tremblaya princeps]|uniref:carbamoyl-phosphate synthase (glutamine-hydrolyzing) n=1 Tax=Tremblaya princeps TaxID=189385 RepID=A0A143WQV6_TREPR|nr:Carbamoyl-phosphate synthase small chain [Candidatus Tremblaya princeps]
MQGRACGAAGVAYGEAVFNTSHTGYQEIVTDPSYQGQVVVLTCPHIGNVGASAYHAESACTHAAGIIARSCCRHHSGALAQRKLRSFLQSRRAIMLDAMDTRALVLSLRSLGCNACAISTASSCRAVLLSIARLCAMVPLGYAFVPCTRRFVVWRTRTMRLALSKPTCALFLDMGAKIGIPRRLASEGAAVIAAPLCVRPHAATALRFSCVVASNGPGNPRHTRSVAVGLASLHGLVPVMGVCLGHQALSLSMRCVTVRMPQGHRGSNHPVRDLCSSAVLVVAQNHGYATDPNSLGDGVEVTHISLIDDTIQGLRKRSARVQGMQGHPEGCSGPHDALRYIGLHA